MLQKLLFYFEILTLVQLGHFSQDYQHQVNNPCATTRMRTDHKPTMVVKDQTGIIPDIYLGWDEVRHYSLTPSLGLGGVDIIIECSSQFEPVFWNFDGKGASAGIKTINVRWAMSGRKRRPICYSSALVITNLTDQLTGTYTCGPTQQNDNTKYNSFELYVPQISPEYYILGETVNITTPNWADSASTSTGEIPSVIIPCRSKENPGVKILLYKRNNKTGEMDNIEQSRNVKFDPYLGFQLSPLDIESTVGFYECKFADTEIVLLRINVNKQPDEKIVPSVTNVRSSAPYLSWTTKSNPKIKVSNSTEHVIWQRLFTKLDYEEDNINSIYYLGSVHIFNQSSGFSGDVSLMNSNEDEKVIHKWNFVVLNETYGLDPGLKYDTNGTTHLFVCKSTSDIKPNISFIELDTNGNPSLKLFPNDSRISELDCGDGCSMISTKIPYGYVKCLGDGVEDLVRYPTLLIGPARPFLIERGHNISVPSDPFEADVTIPCYANAIVKRRLYLFQKDEKTQEWNQWWPVKVEDDKMISYKVSDGFHFNVDPQSNNIQEFLCTSSSNITDLTDAVFATVYRTQTFSYQVYPTEKEVYGIPPFIFQYDSEKELIFQDMNQNISTTNSTTSPNSNYLYRGVHTVTTVPIGSFGKIALKRASDGEVIHTWEYHSISEEVEKNFALRVETVDVNGNQLVVATCYSKTNRKPQIAYVQCQDLNSCSLVENCLKKNCYTDNNLSTDLNCTVGCSTVTIKPLLNSRIKISCSGDGVRQQINQTHTLFKQNVQPNDNEYIFLSVNHPEISQDPREEIQSIMTNLEWEIGDTVTFNCLASPFHFSNGIKWAVEMTNGRFIYQQDSLIDPQFKYSSTTIQVLSTFNLLIDALDIVRVWCFLPVLKSSNEWKNISQPVFVHPLARETCQSQNDDARSDLPLPLIRVISVHPPPSQLSSIDILNIRLRSDKDYIVVPKNLEHFVVEMSGPEPIEWSFSGFGNGPTLTPLIQPERHSTDFYSYDTFCYTSKLLVNLRQKNSNDTGRYTAKYKFSPEKFASFYVFVPSGAHPYLLRSGSQVNETFGEIEESNTTPSTLVLPCLVNDPRIRPILFRKNQDGVFDQVLQNESIIYDPRIGFTLSNQSNLNNITTWNPLGTYKCTVSGDINDFLIINVQRPTRKPSGLKYERVGELNVFLCQTDNNQKPLMTFTELSSDGKVVQNSKAFVIRDCQGSSSGCSVLMTPVNFGSVSCSGEGVEESIRFPLDSDNEAAREVKQKSGLWFDKEKQAFICQTLLSEQPPKLTAVTCRRPNECEIMQSLLLKDGDKSQSKLTNCGPGCSQLNVEFKAKKHLASNWFSIFVQCKGDDVDTFAQYFHFKNETTFATTQQVESFRTLRIDIVTLRQHKSLIQATVRCYANRYFYERGIQWALQDKSGHIIFQETQTRETELQNHPLTMSETFLDFDQNEFQALFCLAPVMGLPRFANHSIPLPISSVGINL